MTTRHPIDITKIEALHITLPGLKKRFVQTYASHCERVREIMNREFANEPVFAFELELIGSFITDAAAGASGDPRVKIAYNTDAA